MQREAVVSASLVFESPARLVHWVPPGVPGGLRELRPDSQRRSHHRTGVGQASRIRRFTSRRCRTLYGTIRKGGGGSQGPHGGVAGCAPRRSWAMHAEGSEASSLPCVSLE